MSFRELGRTDRRKQGLLLYIPSLVGQGIKILSIALVLGAELFIIHFFKSFKYLFSQTNHCIIKLVNFNCQSQTNFTNKWK